MSSRYPVDGAYSLGDDYYRLVDWRQVRKDVRTLGERLCKATPYITALGVSVILIIAAAQQSAATIGVYYSH